jgi:peptidyl-prolyl cis-trans isomerase D
MFDLFRSREKSVRVLLGVLLGLVALSMLVYLIPGGVGSGDGSTQNVVAVVGDEKVTAQDVQRALDRVTRNQANVPKQLLGLYIPSLVNQLVESKAMAYKAREMGLRVSDEELSDTIQNEFAAMLGGKFDMNIYQMAITQQGMTVPDYEKERREALLGTRLEGLETQALVVSDADAQAEYQRRNLKVGLQYVSFPEKDFTSKVSKDPAAIKAYFSKNRGLFRTPEKRDGYLVVGTVADFLQGATISDSAVRKEYQDNIDTYRVPERVEVRHILVKTQGKPKEDVAKLKAKAQDLLTQLQHGGNFAELAKKNSEDPGSAEKGGDLGWITRGQTVPNFESAAFSLKPNQLSNLVETEYGFHILQVMAKQEARTQPFEEVQGQIGADLQKQLATEHMRTAVANARAEVAKNPAQVEAIAKKYNLKAVKLSNFTTKDTLPEVTSPELSNAVFSVTGKNALTDAVDVDTQGKSAFAVVTNITPARDAEFAEVQNEVTEKYVAAESSRLALEAAKAAAERARKGESLETIAKSYGQSVKTAPAFTREGAAEGIGSASLLGDAFKGHTGDIVGPVSAQSSQFVCRVSDVIPANMTQYAANKAGIIQSLQAQKQGIQGPLFRDSIVAELKRRGKIKTYQEALNRMVGAYRT